MNKYNYRYRNKFNTIKFGGRRMKLDRENLKYGLNPTDYRCFDDLDPEEKNDSNINLDLKELKKCYDKYKYHEGKISGMIYRWKFDKKKKEFMYNYDIRESDMDKFMNKVL